jgi:hypothetical protein
VSGVEVTVVFCDVGHDPDPCRRLFSAIHQEQRQGGSFTSASAETVASDDLPELLSRLGYRLVQHNRETWLVEFPRPAARAASAA